MILALGIKMKVCKYTYRQQNALLFWEKEVGSCESLGRQDQS